MCSVLHSGGFWCARTHFHNYQRRESQSVSSFVYEPNHSCCESLETVATAPSFILIFPFFSGHLCRSVKEAVVGGGTSRHPGAGRVAAARGRRLDLRSPRVRPKRELKAGSMSAAAVIRCQPSSVSRHPTPMGRWADLPHRQGLIRELVPARQAGGWRSRREVWL